MKRTATAPTLPRPLRTAGKLTTKTRFPAADMTEERKLERVRGGWGGDGEFPVL